jgi:hypothetical protein
MPSLVLLLLGAGRFFYPTHLLRQVVRHRFENLKLPWSSCLRSSTSDAYPVEKSRHTGTNTGPLR